MNYSSPNALPLTGRRILVTRAVHQAGKLSDGLRVLGAEPVEVPVLELRPPLDPASFDAAIRNLAGRVPSILVPPIYDWLILTSANTVRALADRARHLSIPFTLHADLKIAAIGEGTAAAARDVGLHITLVPESYVAESLSDGLAGHVAGKRILLARAATARDIIPDTLRAAGAQVDIVDAYRNVLPEAAPSRLVQALQRPIHAVTFTSSSSVTHLAEAAQSAAVPWPFANLPAISIGPVTTRTLREKNWPPAIEAGPHDIPGLIAAVVNLLSSG